MKTKIQIKSNNGNVIFEYEKENNTLKDTIEQAVNSGIGLHNANLNCANLRGANLRSATLTGANLRSANLINATLTGADLYRAKLAYADLRGANLRSATLTGANLFCANLTYANLHDANLHGANLHDANLHGANFHGADLHGANLCDANLHGANLCDAENIPYIPLNCPSDGSFIGWKKVRNKLIKLEIPEDARRSSATSNKCRCDKAKVLTITDLDGSNPIDIIVNNTYSHFTYKVGEMVYPDSFDENRWEECSHGIHFFINRQDAIDY